MSAPPKASRRRRARPPRQPLAPTFRPDLPFHCATCESRASGSFSALEGAELSRLDDARTARFYRRGTTIFAEGSRIEGLYCVRSGSVKVFKTAEDGRHYALRIAGRGEVLGLSSLFSDRCCHASAEMLQDGFLCFTNRRVILVIGRNGGIELDRLRRQRIAAGVERLDQDAVAAGRAAPVDHHGAASARRDVDP